MQEMIYLYDGSFDGFLCCIFESYSKKEVLTAIYSDEDFLPLLYEMRTVQTAPAHAARVYRGIRKHSPYAAQLIRRAFLCCMEQREMQLYRLVVRLFREGPAFLSNQTDPMVHPILEAVRYLSAELEKYRGFVRFSEMGGVLGAEITPRNRVLPLLRPHFCSRYQNESLFIFDRTHHEALFYAAGKAQIRPLESFQMAPPDQTEANFRLLWKRFYDTIGIQARENPKLRMSHMPKRYWADMTEFQGPEWFKAPDTPADAAAPSAPDGRSAPGIPPRSEPSAPESIP